jgi:hypothetical protein
LQDGCSVIALHLYSRRKENRGRKAREGGRREKRERRRGGEKERREEGEGVKWKGYYL